MKQQAHATTRTGLAMRWVPVTVDGRVRMEMRWSAPPTISRRVD
jgi:hypothetical protein